MKNKNQKKIRNVSGVLIIIMLLCTLSTFSDYVNFDEYGIFYVNTVEEIQPAIDKAGEEGGGTIILGTGKYVLNNHIHIHSNNINLFGSGTNTILKVDDNAQVSAIMIGSIDLDPSGTPVSKITIKDLTINGNKNNQTSEFYSESPYNEYLRVNGISIRYCRNILIENVFIRSARSGGIVTEKGVKNFNASKLIITNCYFDATAYYNTENSIVEGCIFRNNSAAGISIDWECRSNIFVNNIIKGNGSGEGGTENNPGIYLAHSYNNVFADNIIEANAGNGIIITDQEAVPDSGARCNYFNGNYIQDNPEYGIWVTDDSCTGNYGHGTYYCNNTLGTILDSSGVYNDIDPIIVECDL